MRLTAAEIAAIRSAAREVYGETAVVRVFGSRVDDRVKGGDLDLMVEVDPGRDSFANEAEFLDRIARPLDDLHVDLLVHARDEPYRPIELIALSEGVEL